ncbi:HEPN domain-containing protein [uncultured Psychromonas sp.]|uniref:HEPN domain-containing protein n=1 Tax=uncultured Psychromonas sp. TaxID=173974 RepID=UPI0026345673|nr:HEPN domain-containing protein [uncultured Psychromonas sp.]
MNKFKNVTRIYDLLEKGKWEDFKDLPHRTFGLPHDSLNVVGSDHLLEFNQLINALYESESIIHRSYSQKVFLDRLISFVGKRKCGGEKPKEAEVKTLFGQLKAEELLDYKVYREIFGVVLPKGKSISFGNFKILPFEASKTEEFQDLGEHSLELIATPRKPEYIIRYEVKSRDKIRALELADEAYEKFILFLRYVIGNTNDKFEVGVLEFSGSRSRSAFIISEKGSSNETSRYGYFEPVPLDDSYFVNTEVGFDKIWELIDKPSLSRLEKRFSTAIEWLGRALTERTIQAAFIEASIALESLFTHSEKSIISPSILSQISESTALILGDGYESRIEIERHIKKLYSIRSGIVHAGSKEVASEDFELFISYIRQVIVQLITSKDYEGCTTIENLYDKLKQIKYS